MKISAKQYAKVLFELVKDADEKAVKNIVDKFSQVLIANNKISQIDKIISHFSSLWNKDKKIVEVELTSANELKKADLDLIKKYIEKDTSAKAVEITEDVDKGLIGGFVAKFDDKILDVSIKNRIRSLEAELKRGA